MNEKTHRVFVADDDEAVRTSLTWLFNSEGMDVTTYPSAEAFLDDQAKMTEGCALIDLRMPGLSGLELQSEMSVRNILLPVIMITGHGDVSMAVEAMKRGALDFVEKPFGDEEIIQKVRRALAHGERIQSHRQEVAKFASRYQTLTPREREIAQHVVNGAASREIATTLGISERTVSVHRANIMAKMQAQNTAQLVSMCLLANELK